MNTTELADRCDVRDRQLRQILNNQRISTESRNALIAQLSTIDVDFYRDCAAALRARDGGERG